MSQHNKYDDPLAQAIYRGRLREAWGSRWETRHRPWPTTRLQVTNLMHEGGNAEMDLAIASADEVRKEGLCSARDESEASQGE